MRIVGLTGGIACGKSAVSTAAASWGLRVIDMDEIARRVVCPGLPAYTDIVAAFGDGALLPSGELNRTEVGRIAFSDREKRRALNAATHRPMLMQLLAELAAALFGGEAAVLIDAPLLFETSLHWLCCTTLVVAVAEATQLERLRARDGFSAEEAEKRIAAQMPLAEKCARADAVIDNEGTRDELAARAATILDAAGAIAGGLPWWARLPRTRVLLLDPLLWLLLAALRLCGVEPLPHAGEATKS